MVRIFIACGLAGLPCWLLVFVFAAGSAAGTATVTVFPIPGSKFASPETGITFRGLPADQIRDISVSGSLTGAHSGIVRSDSDRRGGSFIPFNKFDPGELVTVRTDLNILGGRGGTFRFTIATPASNSYGATPWSGRTRGDVMHFYSRPDLEPAAIRMIKPPVGTASSDIFVAPERGPVEDGAMILDPRGRLIWFQPVPGRQWLTDFRVQHLDGEPVLTWWQGSRVNAGDGVGEDVIENSSYRQIYLVRAGNGLSADLHEFQLTPQGTALITAYLPILTDASLTHGSKHQLVLDSVVQEIDIKTGLVVFEWDSLDHVPLTDSYLRPSGARDPFDYFHVNSVAQDGDGNLLISARNTCAIYKLDRKTGAILWTLGGKHSMFKMGPGASFGFQHDVRVRSDVDGLITLFDDRGGPPPLHRPSRGITLWIDFARRTATLARQLEHKPPLRTNYQGSMQQLPGGAAFLGWGDRPYFTELNARGHIILDGRFADANSSYRAYLFPWKGTPNTPPAIAASDTAHRTIVFASWNGATNVARWQVLGGARPSTLRPVTISKRSGFETSIRIPRAAYVAVRALDRNGRTLGVSTAIAPAT